MLVQINEQIPTNDEYANAWASKQDSRTLKILWRIKMSVLVSKEPYFQSEHNYEQIVNANLYTVK